MYVQTIFVFFKILNFQIFTTCFFFFFFFVFFNMEPIGTQNCKTLFLPQITPEFSQTAPEFLSPISSQIYFFRSFEILRS